MRDNADLSDDSAKAYDNYLKEESPTYTSELNLFLEAQSVLTLFHMKEYEQFMSTLCEGEVDKYSVGTKEIKNGEMKKRVRVVYLKLVQKNSNRYNIRYPINFDFLSYHNKPKIMFMTNFCMFIK